MKEFIKKNIDLILIITGAVVAVVGNLIGFALGLPLTFSVYSAILLFVTIGIIEAGLFLLGERYKVTNPSRRMKIRYAAAFVGLIMFFIAVAWLFGGIFG